jgi:hypothetical protein
MHVIKVTHEQYGFGNAVGCLPPQYYGPFPEITAAELAIKSKLWTQVEGDVTKNLWTAQQGPSRIIFAEIVPLEEVQEAQCVDPYDLPSGGTYYN